MQCMYGVLGASRPKNRTQGEHFCEALFILTDDSQQEIRPTCAYAHTHPNSSQSVERQSVFCLSLLPLHFPVFLCISVSPPPRFMYSMSMDVKRLSCGF